MPRRKQSMDDAAAGASDDLIVLPTRTKHAMLDQIHATVDEVLESMASGGPSLSAWRPKFIKKDVAYYVDDNVKPDQYRFCCVADTNTPADEIMKLFLMTDTTSLLKNNRIMYDNVLEARVLSVLEAPTPAQPYQSIYIRYSCFETNAVMDDRDMCVLVATNVVRAKDCSTIGYCLWDSVEIPECPDYRKTRGVVRGRMSRSGFYFHSTVNTEGETTTKIVYLVGLEAGGAAPRLATRFAMERFGAVVGRLVGYFRRKQLDPATFLPRAEWPSARLAKHCNDCFTPLGFLTKRRNCVACGRVFCKACYARERVDIPDVGITAQRFCFDCLDRRGLGGHETMQLTETSGDLMLLARRDRSSTQSTDDTVSFRTTRSLSGVLPWTARGTSPRARVRL